MFVLKKKKKKNLGENGLRTCLFDCLFNFFKTVYGVDVLCAKC